MWLWQSLKASVYDPAFYRTIGERKASGAVVYLALIVFAASVAVSLPVTGTVAGFVLRPSGETGSIRQEVLDLYPDWLELHSDGTRLSMNAESPFAIPLPAGIPRDEERELPRNLIVIDTGKPIERADFKAYDTLIVVGADEIGVFDSENGKTQIRDISDFIEQPFTLTKDGYSGFVSKIESAIRIFGIMLLFLVPLVIFVALLAIYLTYMLFGALVIWVAARLRKTEWRYGTAYQAGLTFLTLPIAYNTLVTVGAIHPVPVPFFFSIILFVLALINIVPRPGISETVPTGGVAVIGEEKQKGFAD